MRLNLLILGAFIALSSTISKAQNNSVAIGQSTTNPNAVLLLVGNGSQGLIIPTVANVSTLNFTTGEKGMVVFDGTSGKVQYFDGTAWNVVGGSGSGTPYTINYNVGTNSVELKQGSATVSTTPIAIGKKPLTSTIPTDTQVLMYNQQADSWIGTSFSGDVKIVSSTAATSGIVNVTGLKGKPLPANFSAGTLTSDASGNLSWAAAGAVVTLANGQILTGNGTTNAATTLSGDASLNVGALTVTGIQGKAIPTLPAAAALQLLSYNGTLNQWEFKDPSGTNIMLKTIYDPTGKAGDAFDLTKHSGVLLPANGGTGLSLPLSGGQILTGNGTTNAATTLSGDASLNGGALKITGIQGIPVSAALPTNNQVLQYNGSNWTPATLSSGTVTSVTGGTGLTGGTITTTGTLGVDVGTTANKIVQLDANAKLPAVDGSALTNLNASNITSGTLPLGRIATGTNGQVLTMVAGTPAWASASLPPSGNLTSSTTGVTITGGTAAVLGSSGTSITIQNATGSQPGLLTGTDWTTFNNKMGSGTSAGGDLSGSYPNPTVSKLQGTSISATTPTNNQVLQYNGSNWAPATLGGTTFGNLTTTTTGLTITGGTGAVAGTGVTIDLQSASATQAGLLTAADWSTFNGKQNALILTTAGTSGVATLVGNTLNIPNYTSTPYTAGTGLTLAANAFSVNAAQNITTLTNLTTKGVVTTTGAGTLGSTQGTGFLKDNGTGTVTYDNSTYLTSYTETDPAVKAINGLVKSNGTTISAATAGTDYQSPLVSGTNIKTINGTSVLGAGNITAVTTETDPSVTAINGLVKSNGTTVSAAVAGTDYVATETDPAVKAISGIVKSNGTTISAAAAGTDYQSPLVSGTNIKTINGASVLGAGNITAVTTEVDPTVTAINGLVKSNGSTISAAVPGTDYLTGNQTITLSGDVTGSGTTAITTTVSKINGSTWPANASGSLTNDGTGVLTWVPAGGSGTVTGVTAGTGLTGGPITTSGTLSVDVGITANKIVQLDATGKLPAVDGSQLTNLPAGTETDPTVKAINGLVKSNGTTISAAVAGTDYVAIETDPSVKAINGLVKSNGTTIGAVVSGTDIKTINATSLLGSGNITVVTAETDPAVKAISGLVKSNGTTISAAAAGTDYQAPITLTTTGSSGASTFSVGTLNVPNYTLAGLGGMSSTLPSANIFVGNGSNVATGVALSGDGTLSNTGALTLANSATTRTNLGLGTLATLSSVTTTEILDGTIADIDVSGSANINGAKINPNFGSQNISTTGTITTNQFIGNNALPGNALVTMHNTATVAFSNGVYGETDSPNTGSAGVWGNSAAGGMGVIGTSNSNYGVYGSSSTGTGIYGTTSSNAAGTYAIAGINSGTGDVAGFFTVTNAASAFHGLFANASGSGAGVFGMNNGTTGSAAIFENFQPSNTNPVVKIWNNGGTGPSLTTENSVGIGTTTPLSKLDVSGDLHLSQITAPSPVTDKLYNVGGSLFWNGTNISSGGASAPLLVPASTDAFQYDSNNSIRLTVNNTNGRYEFGELNTANPVFYSEWGTGNAYVKGNLGLGTLVTPTHKLEIAGAGPVLGFDNNAQLQSKNSGGIYETWLWPRDGDVTYMNYGANGFFLRNNSSVTTMFMDNSNNIGIGTSTPSAKLDIAGSIKIADGTQGAGKVLTSDVNGLASWQAVSGTGTVTTVTATAPLSVTNPTTTPALNITQATTSTNGYLSSADWNTFNGKQGAMTLTTTGTSGVATLVGNTLNVPNYAGTSYLAGTGLTLTTNTFSVNTSQNISTLSNLTTNGLIKTSGGTGALSIATAGTDYVATETDPTVKAIIGLVKSNGTTISAAVAGTDYLTTNQTITLSGDITGSGTTALTTAIGASKVTNTMLAGSIAASKLIGTDINTVGTITSGTWNGTKISETFGGTNQTTYAIGDMLYASASNVLSKLAVGTNGQVLTLAGGVPSWAAASSGWGLTGNAGTAPATNFIGTTDAQDLVFKTNGTEISRITSSGNLGIGTTTPTAKFELKGGKLKAYLNQLQQTAAQMDNPTTGLLADAGITENYDGDFYLRSHWGQVFDRYNAGSGNPSDASYIAGGNPDAGSASFRYYTAGAWRTDMIIRATGNVGIGNANPSAKLDIAGTIKIVDGTQAAGKVLTSDANGLASWQSIPVREVADEYTATASQTSFTLTQTPSVNSKVKFYVNGIRISNTAYSVVGATLTYNPANNGTYLLTAGDRIQCDYYY